MGERARWVEASVYEGRCGGENPLYSARFEVEGTGPDVPSLPAGSYFFAARASDAQCRWFAEGCLQVQLPLQDPTLVVTLDEKIVPPECPPVECNGGLCDGARDAGAEPAPGGDGGVGGMDGGAPGMDAGTPDAGTPTPDAGEVDAGPPAAPLVPSNIPEAAMTAGTDALVLRADDGLVFLDTDAGTIQRAADLEDLRPAGVAFQTVSQPGGAPDLGVFSATSIQIEAGVDLQVSGSAGLVFAASGDVVIDGFVDARGGRVELHTGGPGGFAGGILDSRDGKGPGGGVGIVGGADKGGGGGGHVAAGGRGGNEGGAGGSAYGEPSLVPLVGGAGGGVGGGTNGPGVGGGGGGAVQISSRRVFIGEFGGINAGGGGGQGGTSDDGAGAGGAGGAILIEARTIEIVGGIAANGGGGGAGSNADAPGRNGQAGRLADVAAIGGEGEGEGSSGGAGGATGSPAGGPGAPAADNAGGGGGAAGRIHLRSAEAPTLTGVVSPDEGTSQATL